MGKSDFVFDRGTAIDEGAHGEHDFVYSDGKEVNDGGKSPLVFESGTGLGSALRCISVTPPIDIAITVDNYFDLYINSTSNKIGETTGSGSNEWRDVETFSGISLQSGENILGIRGDNESGGSKDFTWDSSNTSPCWSLFAIRDADGNTFIPAPNAWHETVDGIYQNTNPYGTDWVDPDFDDSAWGFVEPCSETATNNDQYTFSTSDFFGRDPHASKNGTPNSCPGTAAEHGVWFERWCILA